MCISRPTSLCDSQTVVVSSFIQVMPNNSLNICFSRVSVSVSVLLYA